VPGAAKATRLLLLLLLLLTAPPRTRCGRNIQVAAHTVRTRAAASIASSQEPHNQADFAAPRLATWTGRRALKVRLALARSDGANHTRFISSCTAALGPGVGGEPVPIRSGRAGVLEPATSSARLNHLDPMGAGNLDPGERSQWCARHGDIGVPTRVGVGTALMGIASDFGRGGWCVDSDL
jgi:hypothetical protein